MSKLDLVTLQFDHILLVERSLSSIEKLTNLSVHLYETNHDIDQYFNIERLQYDAAKILGMFEREKTLHKMLVYTSVDLFIPIFTFVFGLAKLGGSVAIVSSHRLRNEYYGLPTDNDLLQERLIKETVHELGHLLNLRHCMNFQCVMASSNSIDELDIKQNKYCSLCQSKLQQFFQQN